MIGTRVGQYEIVEELGYGGMAIVYRAIQPSMNNRSVAVKILNSSLLRDQAARDRFTQEAKVIIELEHPYLLPVYDYSAEYDPPYIVMRYLRGATLKQVIETRERIPLNETVYLIGRIAQVLDYAHRRGIIHRDVKPSNIMVDEDGNPYLTDFGIAREATAKGMTLTGFTVGTPGYMSPEQGQSTANLDRRADIYALGVVIFEMVTGFSPYEAETPLALFMQHVTQPIPSALAVNPSLPPEIDFVLAKAMAKNPEDRFETTDDLARSLEGLLPSSEIKRTPERLRTIAMKAVKFSEVQRDQAKINAVMREFENTRNSRQLNIDDVSPPPTRGGSIWLVLSAILTLIIIGGIALYLSGNLPSLDNLGVAALPTTETNTPTNAATVTRRPSETIEPTSTNTQPAATPRDPLAQARRELDIRRGPDALYSVIGTMSNGEQLEVLGISEDSRWYQVLMVNGSSGWILASSAFVTVRGPQDGIAVIVAPTVTLTATGTETYTPIPSATDTPVPSTTPTASPTNTSVPSTTPTASPTNTSVPSTTPTVTPTLLLPATLMQPVLTETELPASPLGSFPTFFDFSSNGVLANSIFEAQNWNIVRESGNAILFGRGNTTQPFQLLAAVEPEWVVGNNRNFVISFDVSIETGARLVFRYQEEVGYNVLEVTRQRVYLRRSVNTSNPQTDRDVERIVDSVGVSIREQEWNRFTIWVEGSRIFVYMNNRLLFEHEDLDYPFLSNGAIWIQAIENVVRFDDIVIQRAELASNHFEISTFPDTWTRSDSLNVTIGNEAGGNQYIRMGRNTTTVPQMTPLSNLELSCRMWSEEGGYQISILSGEEGEIQLIGEAGQLDVKRVDANGEDLWQDQISNFYTRGLWQDFYVSANQGHLTISLDGEVEFQSMVNMPSEGIVRFVSHQQDIWRFDDCLLVEPMVASD